MRIIHTVTKDGESLPYEVLKGLADNHCDHLIHISGPADVEAERLYRLDRKCITENQRKIMQDRLTQPFLYIDSDIELIPGAVDRILGYAEHYDLVHWRHDAGSVSHGFICVWPRVIDAVPLRFQQADKCNVCAWIKEVAAANYRVHMIKDPRLRQIRRITWRP